MEGEIIFYGTTLSSNYFLGNMEYFSEINRMG